MTWGGGRSLGDEPGRLGRLFRFGGGSARPRRPPGPTPPRPEPAADPTRFGSPLLFDAGATATSLRRRRLRIVPRPRVSRPATESDPLVTRVSLGRSDDGTQFGMFLQVFADGTVLDSEGTHHVDSEALRPLVEAIQSSDLTRLKGHCGAPGDRLHRAGPPGRLRAEPRPSPRHVLLVFGQPPGLRPRGPPPPCDARRPPGQDQPSRHARHDLPARHGPGPEPRRPLAPRRHRRAHPLDAHRQLKRVVRRVASRVARDAGGETPDSRGWPESRPRPLATRHRHFSRAEWKNEARDARMIKNDSRLVDAVPSSTRSISS